MVWNNLVSQSATLASRPRVLRATFMCALSATVHFTSTIEAGQRITTPPVNAHNPMVSIMALDGVALLCRNFRPARPCRLSSGTLKTAAHGPFSIEHIAMIRSKAAKHTSILDTMRAITGTSTARACFAEGRCVRCHGLGRYPLDPGDVQSE
ncbi:hypothetical protein ACRQ5Q_42010 (plasmid) [Bradyrhizobium sp. PMVTL-01]|uniref:hypothetical protein n=1 Tax=Bradyrhizobium sp. PMVTL-01 TaxID=3434999 RepID=UPI003F709722